MWTFFPWTTTEPASSWFTLALVPFSPLCKPTNSDAASMTRWHELTTPHPSQNQSRIRNPPYVNPHRR